MDMDGGPGDDSGRGQWFVSMKSAKYEDSEHCALQQMGHSDMLHACLTYELKLKTVIVKKRGETWFIHQGYVLLEQYLCDSETEI